MIDKDRVAVITGATGNLGSVVARSFAEQGARLALFGTNSEHLENLTTGLGLPRDRVLTGAFDFTAPDAAKSAASMVAEKFGRIDILLHLIGGWAGGKSIPEAPPSELESVLNQHVWTTFYLAQAFISRLIENRWGRIIVISSSLTSDPPAKMGPYVAAKAAQEALMLSIAKETAGSG